MEGKLSVDDEIRVIAPSCSWRKNRDGMYTRAEDFLATQGFRVSFGRNVKAVERFETASVAARLQDLHDAYADKRVKAIIALEGGYAANALLPHIDWALVQSNPKPLIGFSDITVLLNGIYAQTGFINYLGPLFSTLGRPKVADYSRNNLISVLTKIAPLDLVKSKRWESSPKKPLVKTRSWRVLQPGEAEGVIVGGNLGSFYLLQGTPYQPRFDRPMILVVEDDDEPGRFGSAREFDRRLESVLQLPGARENVTGLLIGRFQPTSGVKLTDVAYIVRRLKLGGIPVVCDVDFGHTRPLLTLPVGGRAVISAKNNQARIQLQNY